MYHGSEIRATMTLSRLGDPCDDFVFTNKAVQFVAEQRKLPGGSLRKLDEPDGSRRFRYR